MVSVNANQCGLTTSLLTSTVEYQYIRPHNTGGNHNCSRFRQLTNYELTIWVSTCKPIIWVLVWTFNTE